MSIEFRCEHCGKKLSVAAEMADRAVQCECGKWVIARQERGRISRAVSHAFHPIRFGKSVLGKGRKEPEEPSGTPVAEKETPATPAESKKRIHLDKLLLVIAPPDGAKERDWAGLISKHMMGGDADEATAYAYTRQAKEAHTQGKHAEAFDLFESARDCYGQYCQVLTAKVTKPASPTEAEESEKFLSDLEKCMYNFAVLICATRLPKGHEPGGRTGGRTRMLMQELALAAKILKRPKEFWDCIVVFSRNKEQLVHEIGVCFDRYGLKLADFMGNAK